MEREREEDRDRDGWTRSRGIRAEPPSAKWDETPEIERDGEELPRLSPGVGCDSTAQGERLCYLSPCGVRRLNWPGTYVDKCTEWVSS